jgi:hypothetical protein
LQRLSLHLKTAKQGGFQCNDSCIEGLLTWGDNRTSRTKLAVESFSDRTADFAGYRKPSDCTCFTYRKGVFADRYIGAEIVSLTEIPVLRVMKRLPSMPASIKKPAALTLDFLSVFKGKK